MHIFAKNQKYDFRNVVFDELIEIREKNKNLFILTADISAYSLESFKDKFKKNFLLNASFVHFCYSSNVGC